MIWARNFPPSLCDIAGIWESQPHYPFPEGFPNLESMQCASAIGEEIRVVLDVGEGRLEGQSCRIFIYIKRLQRYKIFLKIFLLSVKTLQNTRKKTSHSSSLSNHRSVVPPPAQSPKACSRISPCIHKIRLLGMSARLQNPDFWVWMGSQHLHFAKAPPAILRMTSFRIGKPC